MPVPGETNALVPGIEHGCFTGPVPEVNRGLTAVFAVMLPSRGNPCGNGKLFAAEWLQLRPTLGKGPDPVDAQDLQPNIHGRKMPPARPLGI